MFRRKPQPAPPQPFSSNADGRGLYASYRRLTSTPVDALALKEFHILNPGDSYVIYRIGDDYGSTTTVTQPALVLLFKFEERDGKSVTVNYADGEGGGHGGVARIEIVRKPLIQPQLSFVAA